MNDKGFRSEDLEPFFIVDWLIGGLVNRVTL
jgi:hypothetical protein